MWNVGVNHKMVLSLSIVGIAILVISRYLYSTINNPASYYVIPWLAATLLAVSGFYGIYRPGDSSIALIIVGMCSFFGGCLSIKTFMGGWYGNSRFLTGDARQRRRSSGASNVQAFGLPREARKTLIILGIVALGIELYLAVRSIPLLLSGSSLEYIKFQYSNEAGSTLYATRELLVFQWIALPVIYVAMVMFSCALLNKRIDWPFLWISLVGCALYVVVAGGRMILFNFVCFVIIAIILSPLQKGLSDRFRALPGVAKMLLVVAVIGIVLITSVRSLGGGTSVLENAFFYFAGPITYFDEMLQDPHGFGLTGSGLLYGTATFGFITNPLKILASIIFRFDYTGSDSIVTEAAAAYLPFSDTLVGNAVCTCLYPFMRDFGIAGVAIGPFLFGMMVGFVWQKTFAGGAINQRWFPACVFMMYCVAFSEWRYTLVFPFAGAVFAIFAILNYFRSPNEARALSQAVRGGRYTNFRRTS